MDNAGIDCFPFQDGFSVKLNSRCFPYMKSNQHLKTQKIKNAILSFVNLFIFHEHNTPPEKKKRALSCLKHYRYFFLQPFQSTEVQIQSKKIGSGTQN